MPGSHVSPVYLLLRTKKACVVRTENVLLPIIYTNNCIQYRSGCGKGETHINWSTVIPEKAAPVTGTTLRTSGSVPTDSRQ